MTCDDYRSWISLAADGRLDGPRRTDLSAHLDACSGCRAFETQLDRGRSLLRSLPAVQDEAFTRSVLKAARRRRFRWLEAAAAGLLIAGAVYVAAIRPPSPAPQDESRRDRLWMVLVEAARGPGSASAVRQALHDARLEPRPGEPWHESLESVAAGRVDPAQFRKKLESSGVLDQWRPAGLLPHSGAVDATDPYRRGRQLLHAGAAEEAVAAFHACLDSPAEADRHDDALHWIAFLETRRGRRTEALGAYLSLSMLESPWFDEAARREAQRLTLNPGPMSLRLWVAPEVEGAAGAWMAAEFSPGAAWCSFEAAGGNKGGKDAPVALEFNGRMLRASNAAEFLARYPGEVRELKRRFPEILSFIEEGILEFQIEDPHPPHGP